MASSLPVVVLRLAAFAWLLLATGAIVHVTSLRKLGLVGEKALGSVLAALLPLAVAWILVVILSLSPGKRRHGAAFLAQGLSLGALFWAATILVPSLGRAGTRYATVSFLVLSLVPQVLVLAVAAAGRVRRAPGSMPTSASWRRRALGAIVCVSSFASNTWVQGSARECILTEASAIGDLRAIVSAELVYQAANEGRFGTLDCLVVPPDCLSGYPPQAPPFLRSEILRPVRCGYRFVFQPGAAIRREPGVRTAPGSVDAFAMTAVPVVPGRTGVRAFCADNSGALRFSPDGRMPALREARCPEDLADLP